MVLQIYCCLAKQIFCKPIHVFWVNGSYFALLVQGKNNYDFTYLKWVSAGTGIHMLNLPGPSTILQGTTNCSILPSCMGEHGVSWKNINQNMENIQNAEKMEKMENINQMTLFMIQSTLYVTQSTLFYGFHVDSWKIITWALGEHDLGWPQNRKCRAPPILCPINACGPEPMGLLYL